MALGKFGRSRIGAAPKRVVLTDRDSLPARVSSVQHGVCVLNIAAAGHDRAGSSAAEHCDQITRITLIAAFGSLSWPGGRRART
jgi:hypothetical protein